MNDHGHITKELKEICPAWVNIPAANVFSVPAGYFEGLQAEVMARISTSGFSLGNPFSVPHRYFETLSDRVWLKIKTESEEVNKAALLDVPAGYFEGLADSIMARVRASETEVNETEAISPLVAGIGRRNVFSVPSGYFQNLAVAPMRQPARVVSMQPVRSMLRYAVAAVVAGIIGLNVVTLVDGNGKRPSQQPVAVASVNTAELLQKANSILASGGLENEMSSLSDKEIDQYLQDRGQDVDAALVASSITPEQKLPDAADYILDDNTLNIYLENNNLKN